MKKTICIAIAIVMTLVLAGCTSTPQLKENTVLLDYNKTFDCREIDGRIVAISGYMSAVTDNKDYLYITKYPIPFSPIETGDETIGNSVAVEKGTLEDNYMPVRITGKVMSSEDGKSFTIIDAESAPISKSELEKRFGRELAVAVSINAHGVLSQAYSIIAQAALDGSVVDLEDNAAIPLRDYGKDNDLPKVVELCEEILAFDGMTVTTEDITKLSADYNKFIESTAIAGQYPTAE